MSDEPRARLTRPSAEGIPDDHSHGRAQVADAELRAPTRSQIWSDFFAFLQKLGKSLMLPVAVLPVAGSCSACGYRCRQLSAGCRKS